jgi:hypothetical protein
MEDAGIVSDSSQNSDSKQPSFVSQAAMSDSGSDMTPANNRARERSCLNPHVTQSQFKIGKKASIIPLGVALKRDGIGTSSTNVAAFIDYDDKRNDLIEEDDEDSDDSFIPPEKQHRCILPHYSRIKLYWDLTIMGLAIWNSFEIPINVSFEPPMMRHWAFRIIEHTIDVLFALDIIVNFRTSYQCPRVGVQPKKNCLALLQRQVYDRFLGHYPLRVSWVPLFLRK